VLFNVTVRDQQNGTGIAGINVSLYNTSFFVQSNVSDSEGITNIYYTIPTNYVPLGSNQFIANITNVTDYYAAGNNDTVNIKIWGWSDTTTYLNTSSVELDEPVLVSCLVKDANVTLNLANYYVEIYNGTTNVTAGVSDSSGWFNYTFIPKVAGTTSLKCSIYNNASQYYNVSSNSSQSLTVSLKSNTKSCSANSECSSGYCVHGVCRASSPYCGDGYCDSGEGCASCPADCGQCPTFAPGPPVASTVPGKAVVYIPSIAAGSKANVTIEKTEGIDFSEINIHVVNKVRSVYLTITKLDAKPAEVPAIVNVYRYINVVKENIKDEDISSATIKFKVEKSWINANNIDVATIALYRYANNAWNKLNTTKLSEDANYVYFEAETPGFSYFAISGETIAAVTTTLPTTTTIPTTTTTVPTTTLPTVPTKRVEWIYAVIILVIVVAIFFFLLKFFKKQ
jgi:PGF-pre-PGF domain-containing protein